MTVNVYSRESNERKTLFSLKNLRILITEENLILEVKRVLVESVWFILDFLLQLYMLFIM